MSQHLKLLLYFANHTPPILYQGNCDGCLNFDNEANGGLENIWADINALYDEAIPLAGVKPLSRADFYFVAGTVAVEVTVDYNNQIFSDGTDPESVAMERVSSL